MDTGRPHEGQQPLEPAEVGVDVEADQDQRGVDVRRQHLATALAGGRSPDERRAPGQDATDRGPVVLLDADSNPVIRAHGRVARAGAFHQLGLQPGAQRPRGGEQVGATAMDARDTGGQEPLGSVGCERVGTILVPAETGQGSRVVDLRAVTARRAGRDGHGEQPFDEVPAGSKRGRQGTGEVAADGRAGAAVATRAGAVAGTVIAAHLPGGFSRASSTAQRPGHGCSSRVAG